jgi:hypothetical protein
VILFSTTSRPHRISPSRPGEVDENRVVVRQLVAIRLEELVADVAERSRIQGHRVTAAEATKNACQISPQKQAEEMQEHESFLDTKEGGIEEQDLQNLVNNLTVVVGSRDTTSVSGRTSLGILATLDQIDPGVDEASIGKLVDAATGASPSVVEITRENDSTASRVFADEVKELVDASGTGVLVTGGISVNRRGDIRHFLFQMYEVETSSGTVGNSPSIGVKVVQVNLSTIKRGTHETEAFRSKAVRLNDPALIPLLAGQTSRPGVVGQGIQTIAKGDIALCLGTMRVHGISAVDLIVVGKVLLEVDKVVGLLAEQGADASGVDGLVTGDAIVAEPCGQTGDVVAEEVEGAGGGDGGEEARQGDGHGGLDGDHDCFRYVQVEGDTTWESGVACWSKMGRP